MNLLISAGEASGDLHGARLLAALKRRRPGLTAFGMGGERLESEGRILTRDWERYDGQHVVFQPRGMSVDELQLGTEVAWKHAYSWRGIAMRLSKTVSPWPVAIGANLGYRFYARRLNRFYTCDWPIGRSEPRADFTPLTVTARAEQGVSA